MKGGTNPMEWRRRLVDVCGIRLVDWVVVHAALLTLNSKRHENINVVRRGLFLLLMRRCCCIGGAIAEIKFSLGVFFVFCSLRKNKHHVYVVWYVL